MYYSARLGVGHLATVAALDANSLRLVGVGTSLDLAIGTVIAPNLILRGVFGGSQVTNPTIEMNGRSAETQNVNMTQYWLGAGLAYYWMPLNATAGFSMMASRSSVRVDNSPDAVSTELGPAIALHVGKEWWVADRPALGVTAQAVWASMNDQEERGRQATVTSRSLSLAASLTYN